LLDTTPNTEYNTDMEMTFDTSYIGWILAASFGLYMVYRHIMHRMQELQRSLHDDMRGHTEYVKDDMEFVRNRFASVERRIEALEVAPKAKDSKSFYNTEA
jgi:hypothetical protein